MDCFGDNRGRQTGFEESRFPAALSAAFAARWCVRFRCANPHTEVFRSRHPTARAREGSSMAVNAARIKSDGTGQSPFLSTAMFAPAVLYILLLVGGPFVLAIFYAFSDARIGNAELHFVGLENFRSILESPSFRVAIRNSLVFTIGSQVVVVVSENILSLALETAFCGARVVPLSLGAIGWKWILDSIYSVISWTLVALHFFKPFSAPMWLGEPHLAIASVLLVHSWAILPF